MRRKYFISAVFVLLLLMYIPAFASDDVVLANIGDRKIMLSDLNRIISYYPAEIQKQMEENPGYKAAILENIVRSMTVSKIARKEGFDKTPEMMEKTELTLDGLLAENYIQKNIINRINITEDDMKLYYKTHKDEFTTPEMVNIRHIMVKADKTASEDDIKKAKKKADEILKKIKAGEEFAKAASEFSDDTGTKDKGGEVGFFKKGAMRPEVEEVAFKLKPGELSDIFQSPLGFHIIKLEEKKEAVTEAYDKVRDAVKERALKEFRSGKIEEFVTKAMQDAGVKLNLEPLAPKK